MAARKPLDFLEKWKVTQYWVQQEHPLTRSALVILVRLLERQNTKTGRCDPSVVGLMDETHLSERSVRGAFKELEMRGAIKRFRHSQRSRNQFYIYSVEEIRKGISPLKVEDRSDLVLSMQSVAGKPVTRCRETMQSAAPETIKKKIKKNENAEKVGSTDNSVMPTTPQTARLSFAQIEAMMAEAFERKGLWYEGLLRITGEVIERSFSKIRDREESFEGEVVNLIEQCKCLNGPAYNSA